MLLNARFFDSYVLCKYLFKNKLIIGCFSSLCVCEVKWFGAEEIFSNYYQCLDTETNQETTLYVRRGDDNRKTSECKILGIIFRWDCRRIRCQSVVPFDLLKNLSLSHNQLSTTYVEQ